MSNLSELLPTGGGQNAVDFVASGTLSSGQTVVLNSDGTVSAVTGVTQAVGSATTFEFAQALYIAATFDSNSNKVVVAYTDSGNSGRGTAVVGTVSGTSISFGTPVVFQSTSTAWVAAAFDSTANKVVIVSDDRSSYGTAIVGTVSGTSISFGSTTTFKVGSASYYSVAYNPNYNGVTLSYRDNTNSGYGTAAIGTISGTSIAINTPQVFESSNTDYISTTYDSISNKIVTAYRSSGSTGKAITANMDGGSLYFGTAVAITMTAANYFSATFDSTSNKIVIAYYEPTVGANGSGTAVVGTVSGTSISFGTPVVFLNNSVQYVSSTFDPNAGKVTIAYRDINGGSGSIIVGTVSGTSISFGSPVVFAANTTQWVSSTFDSNSNRVAIAYRNDALSNYGQAVVFRNTTTNSADFIGITAEAISDTATGAVNVYGGINEAQTGLTIGSDYYVQDDGSLSTTASSVKVGQAISATTINMMDLT